MKRKITFSLYALVRPVSTGIILSLMLLFYVKHLPLPLYLKAMIVLEKSPILTLSKLPLFEFFFYWQDSQQSRPS